MENARPLALKKLLEVMLGCARIHGMSSDARRSLRLTNGPNAIVTNAVAIAIAGTSIGLFGGWRWTGDLGISVRSRNRDDHGYCNGGHSDSSNPLTATDSGKGIWELRRS